MKSSVKSRKTKTWLQAAVLAALASGASTAAARVPRIELLRDVRVTGPTVLLSDLLPRGAANSVRAPAEKISLGSAPQPGNSRTVDRYGIIEDIGSRSSVADDIAVPERVVITRDARPITLNEVFLSIQTALRRSDISMGEALRPEDVSLQAQVLVGPGDAGLEVLRSDFDAGMKRGRFLLWPSQDPKVLPFLVTVRLSGASPFSAPRALNLASPKTIQQEQAPAAAAHMSSQVLVSPGETATLLLQSDVLSMVAEVAPLQKGVMGQQVQVRVVETGKVFRAQVDGRAHLNLRF